MIAARHCGVLYRIFAAAVVGSFAGSPVNAQMPDFFGRYVGVLEIVAPEAYFLTVEGQSAYDDYDPDYGDPRQWDDCEPEGIPAILLTPGVATVDLVQADGRIEMQFERDDAVRVIHMDGGEPPEGQPSSVLGYSRGRWDGDALIIETTHLEGGVVIAQTRYPMSRDAVVSERYWRDPGKNDLQMEVTVEDQANYRQPVVIHREWIWSPDAPKFPWNCVSLGPRHSDDLDIDELRRMLEEL